MGLLVSHRGPGDHLGFSVFAHVGGDTHEAEMTQLPEEPLPEQERPDGGSIFGLQQPHFSSCSSVFFFVGSGRASLLKRGAQLAKFDSLLSSKCVQRTSEQ